MTARILVVDDVPANLRLLEARLLAEYFEVLTATSGAQALELCETGRVDVVLLDIMMPEMDGFEVCRRIKADPATAHIPVVMVTALDQVADRIRGLEVGADDFLTKPANDLQLMTRVKSLVRLKVLSDELRLRASTTRAIGVEALIAGTRSPDGGLPRILLVDGQPGSALSIRAKFADAAMVDVTHDPQDGLFRAAEGAYDCIVITTAFEGFDPLRLCSQLRSLDRTRFLPIILVVEPGDDMRVARALELGVNDYIVRPLDPQELIARMRTQVKRKRYNDHLRASVTETIELAVTDGLTGLHNRRYLDSHLLTLVDRAQARRRPLSLMITDLDRFKAINDAWGHDGGDAVLREFAGRLRRSVRGVDLACRYGGEEFVVVMPDTDGPTAERIAERLRSDVAAEPFAVGDARVPVTISVGVAQMYDLHDDAASLIKRADRALYDAKNGGRNRVVGRAA
ncbi:PleD family two-component system response regulator [Aquibium carbonis]|uniref:diguanylate cyclase n=1 Tax=Aquibium carbonis TaxID=2495581 RepID=A0A3R9YF92_9HYPH|nr:PleD family two-component system response regulator [Aquibium carbonis]RST86265.1 PleD family two-component system response regulator [Aquibium carbonis]